MTYLFYFIHLHLIIAIPQINLYYTDFANISDDDALEHHCLHTITFVEEPDNSREIVSFCMSESPSKFDIEINDYSSKFTFAELWKQNITSQQLYFWSASIDVIERYQIYLNQLLISSDQPSAREVFYNCTMPRFGPKCQYELDYDDPNYSSLHEMIDNFYSSYKYKPTSLTCYIHLQCNRGFSACLDWTEICDGHIDCLDSDLDEQHCWQLEINECKDNEYRCANGQCIPQSFYQDKMLVPDCLDMSDEFPIFLIPYRFCDASTAGFRCEDATCAPKPFTSSCTQQREELLLQAMFSVKGNNISDDCWSAFKCMIPMGFESVEICNEFCQNDICVEIIEHTCPDIFHIPAVPFLYNHIYFAYEKHDAKILNNNNNDFHPYVCYNDSRYDDYFITGSKVFFNNVTCYRNIHQPIASGNTFSWDRHYLVQLYRLFRSYELTFNYNSEICNRLNMYQCVNSLKCISIHRLSNNINDCPQGDDEKKNKINSTDMSELFTNIQNWWGDESDIQLQYARNHISFQTICDGFTELLPITINEQNETDETECDQWQCNNIYTRCNQVWNCLDGADEIGCELSSSLQCSSNHHICVSSHTNKLICLPITKANDGNIDCLGALDEPTLCRIEYKSTQTDTFYCKNRNNVSSCIPARALCNTYKNCYHDDDEQFCRNNGTFTRYSGLCALSDLSLRSDVEKFVCKTMRMKVKNFIVYFSLDGMTKATDNLMKNIEPRSSVSPISRSYEPRCHRGLDLRVWLNTKNNLTTRTCLCPPSFYGDICQYQNQRVSLAIKFRALSDSWEIPFTIIISLIDDSNERIIHSYEQITYLSMRDCNIKYNIYLRYSTRPKNPNKYYSIHIDIYEKLSLIYRGSLLLPITFTFLPVHRLAYIVDIPRSDDDDMQTCSNRRCIHGKCIKYLNNPDDKSFCQCNPGWSGRYCTIPYSCMCSNESLCIGVSANNRSICVCPIHKFGPRCILNTVCQNDSNSKCQNGGQCIPIDEYMQSIQAFTCICPQGFTGDRCELADNKIIVSFEEGIILSQSIFIHFIEIIKNNPPIRATTFRTIPIQQDSIIIQWSQPFHLVFIELFNKNYYLTVVQNTYNRSATLIKVINPWDRCQHINDIFNETFIELHLLRRIKYYHLPCQQYSLNLSCFYDDIHMCLCYNFGQQRLANCFEFDHSMTFDCSGQSECENGGQCFQDTPNCPQRSMCVCLPCFFGRVCQFSTNRFGLSLDAILGYHIHAHSSITHQPTIVKISMILTIIFVIIGLINGVLSMMTFKNKIVREVGCGLYLYSSSITALCTIIMFGLKFMILLLTQMTLIPNRTFLSFQCHTNDFLLRVCLSMDQWLSACVALERVIITKKGTMFNKRKSQQAAKIVIIILLIIIIGTSIHDSVYRRLIVEENDDEEERIWCIVTYPSNLQIFNSVVYICHFFGPFTINLISAIILVTDKSRQQSNLNVHRTYKQILRQQFRQHKHLFTAPILLVILALPRLIIFFASKCMKSANDSWLFLVGYFISFVPSMATFVIFILPSKFYKKHFHNSVAPYQITMHRRLRFLVSREI